MIPPNLLPTMTISGTATKPTYDQNMARKIAKSEAKIIHIADDIHEKRRQVRTLRGRTPARSEATKMRSESDVTLNTFNYNSNSSLRFARLR